MKLLKYIPNSVITVEEAEACVEDCVCAYEHIYDVIYMTISFWEAAIINTVTVIDCLARGLFKMGFYYTQISTIYKWLQLTAL
jgi:hypothetical protein